MNKEDFKKLWIPAIQEAIAQDKLDECMAVIPDTEIVKVALLALTSNELIKNNTEKRTIFEETMEKEVKAQNDKMIDDVFIKIELLFDGIEPKEGFETVQA